MHTKQYCPLSKSFTSFVILNISTNPSKLGKQIMQTLDNQPTL